MYSYEDNIFFSILLEPFIESRKDVPAIDAIKCPEINDDDLPPEFRQHQRLGVEPEPFGELGGRVLNKFFPFRMNHRVKPFFVMKQQTNDYHQRNDVQRSKNFLFFLLFHGFLYSECVSENIH